MTRIKAADEAAIAEAAALIRAGELVAFPTETVYGLGANAFDSNAVAQIFTAKGRPPTDPLIVHIASQDTLSSVVDFVSPQAERLIDAFWPGPLTLILPRGSQIPPNVSAGLSTVAVRMPANPIALALISAAGVPIAAPSANRFAHTSPTSAQHVYNDLAGRLPLILDGGSTRIGLESSIVDLTSERPRLLRPGGTSPEAIARIVPDLEIITRYADSSNEALPAPGMLLKHYSPRAELRLFDGESEAVRVALRQTAYELMSQDQQVGLLVAEEDRAALLDIAAPLVVLGSLNELEAVARHLFAGLRDLDSLGVNVILARAYPPTGIGLAIRDRLLRAAEGRLIQV